jgi:ubiquinone/menaquinone biosynthesis C-methylase UbiE
MRFYRDIIPDLDGAPATAKYHYHEWSPRSIAFYWDVCANNPFMRRQFYPLVYWEDLLAWSSERVGAPPETIVDIGCGTGNLIACLRRAYHQASICGVDLTDDSMEVAKKRFKDDRRVEFKVGGFEGLPFDDHSVDLITCTEVLEHTFPETFEKSFSEINRVLKPGGYYLASVPFDEPFRLVCCPECGSLFTPYQHMMFEITHESVRRLLSQNGLQLVDFYQSLDRTEPGNPLKKALKPFVIKWLPGLAKRIFPKDGVSGFLARAASTR